MKSNNITVASTRRADSGETNGSFYYLALFLLVSALMLVMPLAGAEEEGEDKAAGSVEPAYLNIDPPFVTNYGGTDRLRYVKVEVTLKVAGPDGVAQMNHHMPHIRDQFLTLFAQQTSASINSIEGKEKMRAEILANISEILAEEDDESHLLEVLFTNFVAHSL